MHSGISIVKKNRLGKNVPEEWNEANRTKWKDDGWVQTCSMRRYVKTKDKLVRVCLCNQILPFYKKSMLTWYD